jgi:uncharacterized protein (DUF885 family)
VLEFLRQRCQMDDAFLQFRGQALPGWPGEAPSYKVGGRIWLEAREGGEGPAGLRLRSQGVPPGALDLGSFGLDPLRAALARI